MRLLTTLAVILTVIIGLGFWNNYSLQQSSAIITRQIDTVAAEVGSDSWPAAEKEIGQLEKMWKREARWWPVFLDHQEMDNIEFSLARTKEYVTERDTSMVMGQLSELRTMVGHIPRKEAVKLENIL